MPADARPVREWKLLTMKTTVVRSGAIFIASTRLVFEPRTKSLRKGARRRAARVVRSGPQFGITQRKAQRRAESMALSKLSTRLWPQEA